MTSDNIAEYVGENNQFTEKPVTEYPPVIQDNTVTTKDYLYSNNIDTDLLVVIGGKAYCYIVSHDALITCTLLILSGIRN